AVPDPSCGDGSWDEACCSIGMFMPAIEASCCCDARWSTCACGGAAASCAAAESNKNSDKSIRGNSCLLTRNLVLRKLVTAKGRLTQSRLVRRHNSRSVTENGKQRFSDSQRTCTWWAAGRDYKYCWIEAG